MVTFPLSNYFNVVIKHVNWIGSQSFPSIPFFRLKKEKRKKKKETIVLIFFQDSWSYKIPPFLLVVHLFFFLSFNESLNKRLYTNKARL